MIPQPTQRPLVQRYVLTDDKGRARMVGPLAHRLVESAVREGLTRWRLYLHGRLVGKADDLDRLS